MTRRLAAGVTAWENEVGYDGQVVRAHAWACRDAGERDTLRNQHMIEQDHRDKLVGRPARRNGLSPSQARLLGQFSELPGEGGQVEIAPEDQRRSS